MGHSISVALRELTPGDLEPCHRLLSDWSVVRYMMFPHCGTKEESRKCLDGLIAEGHGEAWLSVVRAIEIRNSGEVIGLCGIAVMHGSVEGEIWYLVRPDHWGNGIAAEAARALLKIGFSKMNLQRIFAACVPENSASARVLDKIGMEKGADRLKNLIHDVWHDCLLYAITRGEWEAATSAMGDQFSVSVGA